MGLAKVQASLNTPTPLSSVWVLGSPSPSPIPWVLHTVSLLIMPASCCVTELTPRRAVPPCRPSGHLAGATGWGQHLRFQGTLYPRPHISLCFLAASSQPDPGCAVSRESLILPQVDLPVSAKAQGHEGADPLSTACVLAKPWKNFHTLVPAHDFLMVGCHPHWAS